MKTTKWEPSEYIHTKDDVIGYLSAALEDEDGEYALKIVEYILRSEGINEIAHELGTTRDELCLKLAPTGNPTFETVVKLLGILGFRLKLEAKSA